MSVIFALFLLVFGGIINGSFALPTKHIPKWKFENIWLQFSVWTFLIFPWVIAYFLSPQILHVYEYTPLHILLIMVIGGVIFGIGQICFALAMKMIGIGLAFVLNLGLSIVLGFLLPLLVHHTQEIFQPFGIVTLIGCLVAVIALVFSYHAGNLHDKEKQKTSQTIDASMQKLYGLGVILAIIAGLSSAFQNFTFASTASMQQLALHMGAHRFAAASILWPGFLLCGFIPYALYMLFLNIKNRSFGNYAVKGCGMYYIFAFIMGVLYYASTMLYSKASFLIGNLGPMVGWPLYMALIVLASNFWSWRSGEWTGCSAKVKHTMWKGLLLLILAIVILGYSASFHT